MNKCSIWKKIYESEKKTKIMGIDQNWIVKSNISYIQVQLYHRRVWINDWLVSIVIEIIEIHTMQIYLLKKFIYFQFSVHYQRIFLEKNKPFYSILSHIFESKKWKERKKIAWEVKTLWETLFVELGSPFCFCFMFFVAELNIPFLR